MENAEHEISLLKKISAEKWLMLSKKKIFFGHKSVGYNILAGIQDIMEEIPAIKLSIVDEIDEKGPVNGYLYQKRIGDNGEPLQKIKNYENEIMRNYPNQFDIAMLKLCYIDIKANTSAHKIFNAYKESINRIEEKDTDIQIIHYTVPLTIVDKGIKANIKKLFGKKPNGLEDNMNRFQYNILVKKEFGEREHILDIAEIESSYMDGSRDMFSYKGKQYYKLIDDYTTDGGHLNEIGRKKVAARLLLLLIEMI